MRRIGPTAAVLIFLCTLSILAQGESTPPKQDDGGQSFFVIFFLSGGDALGVITTLPLVVLNFLSMWLIIEFSMTLKREKLINPDVIVQLEEHIDKGEFEEALNLCEADKTYVTNIVGAGLMKTDNGVEGVMNAAESQVVEENTKLLHKISWLNLVGNIGPMLGLFGTVVGMVAAFSQIASSSEQPSPKDLAGGIFTALITTVWGLIIAVPALSAFFIFKNRLQRLGLEFTAIAGELLDKIKARINA